MSKHVTDKGKSSLSYYELSDLDVIEAGKGQHSLESFIKSDPQVNKVLVISNPNQQIEKYFLMG